MEFLRLDVPVWPLLVILILILLYIHGTWNYSMWSKQGIKGPTAFPYIGTVLATMAKGNFIYTDLPLKEKYGHLIGGYDGSVPNLQVSDPEFLRKAYIKEFNSMPNRRSRGDRKDILGMFLTALKDDHWKHVRSSLTPTFTSGKLKHMKRMIDVCADKLISHLQKTVGQSFDTKKYASCFTMDVITSTAFGMETDSMANPDDPILKHANNIMGQSARSAFARMKFVVVILLFFLLPPKLTLFLERFGLRFFDKEPFDYFERLSGNILDSRLEESSSGGKDFVELCKSQLIPDPTPTDEGAMTESSGAVWSKKGLTRSEIVANAILFFLAGFETTASTLGFVFYELAMNPEIQDRAYEEIMSTSSEEYPSYDELNKMEYLDWLIEEALRLYPPAPRIDRQTIKEVEIDGVTIPAGSLVTAMTYAIHMDPEYWPDPTKFDPERYSPENKEDRHPCAWSPFGIGNRNCIGMRLALLEVKIAIVQVLRTFRLERCPATLPKPVKFAKNFRNNPASPLEVAAVPRQD